MEKMLIRTKTIALMLMGFLAIFVAGGVIGVVFDAVTWEQLGDWMIKAVLVSVILLILSAIVGVIMTSFSKNK